MRTLYMPLRSNAGWFSSEDTHAELDRRLKSLVVTYDKLLQDGRYDLTVWQDGQLMDLMAPAHSIGAVHRTQLRFAKQGAAEFHIGAGYW